MKLLIGILGLIIIAGLVSGEPKKESRGKGEKGKKVRKDEPVDLDKGFYCYECTSKNDDNCIDRPHLVNKTLCKTLPNGDLPYCHTEYNSDGFSARIALFRRNCAHWNAKVPVECTTGRKTILCKCQTELCNGCVTRVCPLLPTMDCNNQQNNKKEFRTMERDGRTIFIDVE